jgi:hypothetical protein
MAWSSGGRPSRISPPKRRLISGQYLLEAGAAVPLPKIRGLSIEAGFQYARGRQLLTGTVGKAILRGRTRSYPDRVYGSHGNTAFAGYVWLASYSVRFGGRQHAPHH